MPSMAFSMSCWNEAGHPSRPIGLVIHLYCPFPGIVKAVRCESFGCIGICQKPEVRLIVVKMFDSALPISTIHSLISFMEYLSMWTCWFSSRKSCTILRPAPFFLGTRKMGEFYIDDEWRTTPSFNHSAIYLVRKSLWESGILNCFWYTGQLSLRWIRCSKCLARPKSCLPMLMAALCLNKMST